jgi:putative intracellular protease/amidase
VRIAIPLFDRFTALDAVGPYEVLSRVPGAEVVFVGERTGEYRADTGVLGLTADAALDGVAPASVDVLVVPGGFGTRPLAKSPDNPLVRWIGDVHPSTTWTTSVCTGALLLGAAGVLEGLPATTHWRLVDALASYGATPVRERVVRAGKVVTAAGVSAGIDMALTLTSLLADEATARAIQLAIEYDPQPPFDSGSYANATPELLAALDA